MTTHKTRLEEWDAFAAIVREHIQNYTIRQYKDMPDDLASEWSRDQMIEQIKKYANRHGRNQRPDQKKLDPIKMAHYAAMIFFKEESNAIKK